MAEAKSPWSNRVTERNISVGLAPGLLTRWQMFLLHSLSKSLPKTETPELTTHSPMPHGDGLLPFALDRVLQMGQSAPTCWP